MNGDASARRTRLLATGVAALLAFGAWLAFLEDGIDRPSAKNITSPSNQIRARSTATPRETVARFTRAKPTRAEVVDYLVRTYRKEQLARELDLEQRRYGRAYWNSECNGVEAAALGRERENLLRELNAEANAILAEMFPSETGAPIALRALFHDARPGPNLGFLSADSRQRFETEILASDRADPDRLLEIAEQVLPPEEMATYRQWNDPAAAALRRQLVGFEANEAEFLAILRDRHGAKDRVDDVGSDLAAQLGAERYGAFLRRQDPGFQTALHELNRLGLPLAQAEELATLRRRALADINEAWQDPTLSVDLKKEKVARLQHTYGESIATRLALPTEAIDDLALAP